MESEPVTVMFVEASSRTFAVDTGQVQGLRRKETLLSAPPGHHGLIAFLPQGGTIVPVLDMAVRLGICTERKARRGILLITAVEETLLSFLVDRIEGPVTLGPDELVLLPELLQELQLQEMVWGLVQRENSLVPLLDLERIVLPEEAAALYELALASVG